MLRGVDQWKGNSGNVRHKNHKQCHDTTGCSSAWSDGFKIFKSNQGCKFYGITNPRNHQIVEDQEDKYGFMVVTLDDFDLIFGLEFFVKARAIAVPHLRELFVTDEMHLCFVQAKYGKQACNLSRRCEQVLDKGRKSYQQHWWKLNRTRWLKSLIVYLKCWTNSMMSYCWNYLRFFLHDEILTIE